MHMHESAHGIVNPFKFDYTGAPKLYSEGITDFIRFVARSDGGIDRGWTVVDNIDSSFFDEKNVWEGGYRPGARFLLWLTQHYDTSGGEYRMVHDLNALLVSGNRDWQGVFTRIFGRSFHELFQAYKANSRINKHCG
jgi:Peptidase of plants and bacteria